MEAISTEMSPISSSTPPISPYVHFHHTQPLPPLKTLPTWNRTKFNNRKKHMRSIPKNQKLKLELLGSIKHNETCTQTSPPNSSSTRTSEVSVSFSPIKMDSTNKVKQGYENKIVFLQSNQEQVLSNLHHEIEKLKIENKALQFQVIIAGGSMGGHGYPIVKHADKRKTIKNDKIDHMQLTYLHEEINTLKKSLNESKQINIHLTKLLEEQRERSKSAHIHAKMESKAKTVLAGFDHHQHNSRKTEIGNIRAEKSVNLYQEKIKELKELTNQQQSQLLHLQEQLQDQQTSFQEKSITLPKLNQRDRSARIASKSATVNQLNSLNQTIHEPLSLPMLPSFPGNINLSLRQKRAQALHIQRQRSNKDISLMLDIR